MCFAGGRASYDKRARLWRFVGACPRCSRSRKPRAGSPRRTFPTSSPATGTGGAHRQRDPPLQLSPEWPFFVTTGTGGAIPENSFIESEPFAIPRVKGAFRAVAASSWQVPGGRQRHPFGPRSASSPESPGQAPSARFQERISLPRRRLLALWTFVSSLPTGNLKKRSDWQLCRGTLLPLLTSSTSGSHVQVTSIRRQRLSPVLPSPNTTSPAARSSFLAPAATAARLAGHILPARECTGNQPRLLVKGTRP